MVTEEPNVSMMGRYSITDVTKLLGIHRNTVRKLMKDGKMRFGVRKANNRVFIPGSAVLEYWRRQY